MLWETEVEVTLASIQVTRRLRVLAKEEKYFTRPVYDLSGGKCHVYISLMQLPHKG